jgi:Flp pilus assembly protein TadD
VAWISERKDVLSTCFGLLALWFYARYAQKRSRVEGRESNATGESLALDPRPSTLDYSLALVFFTFSLMSKPMLVTMPFLMLLLDWWPLQRFKIGDSRFKVQSLVWEKIPFCVLGAISCVVTFIAQQKGGAVATLVNISMTGRVENTFVAYARYLGKTLWPVALGNPYPHPGHWPVGLVVFTAGLIAGLSIVAVWLGRKLPFVLVGWFWFLGTLVPVIGLVQVGIQSLADRYTYVPLTGVFIILVWGFGAVCGSRSVPRPWIVLISTAVLAACAIRTRDQLQYWQNNETLFRHTLAVTENNYLAYNNLGTWLSKKGQIAEAMDCFHKSLQINPNNSDVLYNLGNAFAKLGNWDEAIVNYQHALQVAPGQADLLDNLGFAFAAKKRFTEAISCFEGALKIDPDSTDAHNNLATVYFMQKNFDDAVRHFREAVRLDPGNPQFHSNLGDALAKSGQTAEAIKSYQETLQLKPDDLQVKAKLKALGVAVSD